MAEERGASSSPHCPQRRQQRSELAQNETTSVSTSTSAYEFARTLEGHLGKIRDIEISYFGVTVATASADASARIWDARDGKLLYHMDHNDTVTHVNSLGEIVTLTKGANLRVWSLSDASLLVSIDEGVNARPKRRALAVHPNGEIIYSGTTEGTIQLHKIYNGFLLETLVDGHSGPVTSILFNHFGDCMVSGTTKGGRGALTFWNVTGTSKEILHSVEMEEAVADMRIFPYDARFLITKSTSVEIWSMDTREKIKVINVTDKVGLLRVAAPLPPKANSIILGGSRTKFSGGKVGHSLNIMDIATEEIVPTAKGEVLTVNSLAVSSSGRVMVTGTPNGTVNVWSLTPPLKVFSTAANAQCNMESRVAVFRTEETTKPRKCQRLCEEYDACNGYQYVPPDKKTGKRRGCRLLSLTPKEPFRTKQGHVCGFCTANCHPETKS